MTRCCCRDTRHKAWGIFALLMTVCMLLGACTPVNTGDAEATSDEPPAMISLAAGGATEYTIIRPEKNYGDVLKDAVNGLRAAFKEYTAAEPEVIEDWVKDVSELPAQAKEILIGETNRAESAAALEGLKADDFCIRADAASGRIVIVGGSDPATAGAVEYFIEHFVRTAADGGAVEISEGFCYTFAADYTITRLTLCGRDIGEYEIVIPDSANRDGKYASLLIAAAITDKTGITLPVVAEKKVSGGPAILTGRTATGAVSCAEGEFCIGSARGGAASVLVGGDKGRAVAAARAFIERYISGASGEVSIELTEATAEKYSPAVYPDDALGIVGGTRVALADQKNAACVVVDIADGSNAKALWSFAPTPGEGFNTSGYGNRIDECRLRYSEVLGTYVLGITSSSGCIAVAEYPSGKRVFSTSAPGYGPHSIEYLPCGAVAVACSGNGDESKACVRFYPADADGKIVKQYQSIALEGAHGVIWDDVRGVLWTLGTKKIIAFEVVGEGEEAKLSEISLYGASIPKSGGHDISAVMGDSDKMWIGGANIVLFDKSSGSFSDAPGSVSTGSVKCIGNLEDGRMIRTVAANVYAAHDTDRFLLFDAQGNMLSEVVFPTRAFYKARLFDPRYT